MMKRTRALQVDETSIQLLHFLIDFCFRVTRVFGGFIIKPVSRSASAVTLCIPVRTICIAPTHAVAGAVGAAVGAALHATAARYW
eukprot:SAG31_NODE_1508_length_8063_cov_3.156956_1_plen_85_part_00